MMNNLVFKYNDKDTLIEDLSKNIAHDLKDSVYKNKKATLIVSGGNTPKALFERLSNEDIAWEKITIGLCDERWVDPANDDSNEKMIKEYLLQNRAKKARFIGMYENIPINKAVDKCSQKIKNELFPFDVLILGLGNDGHTASLFPNNKKLNLAYTQDLEKLCIDIEPQTAPHERMSLTKSAILSAKSIYLHFEGKTKTAVFQEALSKDNEFEMPIRAILNQNAKEIKVYYYE